MCDEQLLGFGLHRTCWATKRTKPLGLRIWSCKIVFKPTIILSDQTKLLFIWRQKQANQLGFLSCQFEIFPRALQPNVWFQAIERLELNSSIDRAFHELWVFAQLMCNRRLGLESCRLVQPCFAVLAGHLVCSAFQTKKTQGHAFQHCRRPVRITIHLAPFISRNICSCVSA